MIITNKTHNKSFKLTLEHVRLTLQLKAVAVKRIIS